jgi:hypothetical protein
MRNLAVLNVGAVTLICTLNSVGAQDFRGSENAAPESVVYTLELTDQMIEDLRNGQSLRSEIPPHLRGKVTEVRLRFAPSSQSRNPPSSRQNQFGNSVLDPFSGAGSSRSTPGGLPRAPGDSPLQPPPSTATGGGQATGNSQQSIPRFNPPNRFGDQSSQSQFGASGNSGMGVAGTNQYASPIGPPSPWQSGQDSGNSYGTPTLPPMAPVTNQGGFQAPPRQPASTQEPFPGGQYSPRPPGDSLNRPVAPTGNEFDTASHRQQGIQPTNPWSAPPAQSLPQNEGYRPSWSEDRFATNSFNRNEGWPSGQSQPLPPGGVAARDWQPRNGWVPGHDVPMIANSTPRTAARAGYDQQLQSTGNQDLAAASIPGNQPSDDKYVAVNEGPNGVNANSPVSQLNQFNNFLYFLLLCSIGLNIYLAWISRGFYVRYRELADELRDTFSTAA